MKKLNFGCGRDIKKDYVNLDIVKHLGVNVVHDVGKFPYPFEDNYFDEIYARFVLEHLDNLEGVMRDLHRIIKPGGILILELPYQTCIHTWASYQHKRAFTLRALDGFATKTTQKYGLNSNDEAYGLSFKFSLINRRLYFPRGLHLESYLLEPLFNCFPKIYEETFLRYVFPAFSIKVMLKK